MNDKWLRIAGGVVAMVAGLGGVARASGPLDSWQTSTLGTMVAPKIAFGNGVFVAPGNKTGINTWGVKESTDGVTWTSTVSFAGVQAPSAFAFANGTWVMGTNDGAIFTSPDATQWTGRVMPVVASAPLWIHAAAFDNGTWMAIGHVSFMTSTDLVTWTKHNFAIDGRSVQATSLAARGGTFVATIGTSIVGFDGTRWTTRFTGTSGWEAVAAGPSGFVAVGDSGVIATSPDGIIWHQRTAVGTSPANAGIRLNDIAYGAGGWVTVGERIGGSELYSSPDGSSWTSHAIPANGASLQSVAFGGGRYVVTARDASNHTTAYASGIYAAPLTSGITTVLTNPKPIVVPTAQSSVLVRKP